MSKTNDLRKLIQGRLLTLKTSHSVTDVYYRLADENALFNHVVFDFNNVFVEGLYRGDYQLNVDIYANDSKVAENVSDEVERLFHMENLPQDSVLPTFFFESRRNLPDEDRNVRHIQVVFTIQNYER